MNISSLQFESHTNALLRCLHSNSDLLAHFIYFCFKAKSDKNMNINLKTVKDFPTLCSVEAEPLKKLLCEYEDNIPGKDHKRRVKSDYWYLDALVNHNKHLSNILPRVTYNLKKEDKDIYRWDFEEFTYKGAAYPKQKVFEFIKREYDRQSELLPQIIEEVDLLNAKLFEN
ncbi:hypothetical protein [Marinomonas sp. GJ51-6]|uniref:hypothetical protein n=1 Tax=Marinomonas sp. GJ51-6 TaxID=2992802 RepID=UPI002935090A|nr:hypothetical protein [Marinomonas sp. GJ51-6]WOD08901.1 hypothetical protein ONZ50_07610 [Marinomonas sp. GJ51-6]